MNNHLDDEALSALLDGEPPDAPGDPAAHTRTCPTCSARLDALSGARAALRAARPDPLDEVTRRRLVDRAAAATASTRVARTRARSVPTTRTLFLRLGTAAAAVVAVLVAATVMNRGGSGDEAASPARDGAGSEFAQGLPPDVVTGDLGAIDDPEAIRSFLARSEQSSAGAAAQAGGTARESDDAASDDRSLESPAAAAPQAAPTGGFSSVQLQRCADATAAARPEGSRLSLAGTGTFKGAQVMVLGYRDPATDRVLVLVVQPDDCAILSFQSFQ